VEGGVVRLLMVVVPGIAERGLASLSGRTPLEVAAHPSLDRLATRGRLGTVQLAAPGARSGTILGLVALLGHDASGLDLRRGPLEAAGLGVPLAPDDLALRLHFVSTFEGMLADARAGQVTDAEAALLLDALRRIDVGPLPLRIHPGSGYRHLAVVAGGARLEISTVAPHAVLGSRLDQHWPKGRDAEPFVQFLSEAARILPGHEVNRVRVDLGENPADAVWLWGEGTRRALPPLPARFGGRAAMVAAAPLVRGLGLEAGMDVPGVRGATGDERSDLVAKAQAALDLLETHDFALVHVAAVNEASRSGDVRRKVAALERLDRDLVTPLLRWVEADLEQRRLLVASDHSTSVETRARAEGPVPFVLFGASLSGVRERRFSEPAARCADLKLPAASALLDWFLKEPARPAAA
jgi:2,3-bisphosphoglycerate-independent phosphoglycerate mutase